MAVEYLDSFSVYGASNGSSSPPVLAANLAQLQRDWNNIEPGIDLQTRNDGPPYPTGSGYVLQMNTGENISQTLTHRNRWVVGFRMNCFGAGFGGREFYRTANLSNNGTTQIILLYAFLNVDGTISLNTNGVTIATSTFAVNPGDWHYYEVIMFFDDTNPGNIEVTAQCYVDNVLVVGGAAFSGVPVSSVFTGMLTQSATTNSHALLCPCAGTGTSWFGDLYILNTVGPDNVSRLGPIKLGSVHPRQDQDTQWTPSTAGTHFSLVNENPEDLDATYVSDSNVGDNDTYLFDMLVPGTFIPAVQIRTCCRKTDQGVRTIEAVVGAGGTEAQGPTTYLHGNYVWERAIFERDPASNSPWTVPGFNITPFGPRMTS